MKNLRVFVITLLLAIAMLTSFSSMSFAKTSGNEKYYSKALEFIQRISNNLSEFNAWKKGNVSFKSNLYSPTSDSITAILFDVINESSEPCGYIIMDYNTLSVIEFSSKRSPYMLG